jgi:hypothetical protein
MFPINFIFSIEDTNKLFILIKNNPEHIGMFLYWTNKNLLSKYLFENLILEGLFDPNDINYYLLKHRSIYLTYKETFHIQDYTFLFDNMEGIIKDNQAVKKSKDPLEIYNIIKRNKRILPYALVNCEPDAFTYELIKTLINERYLFIDEVNVIYNTQELKNITFRDYLQLLSYSNNPKYRVAQKLLNDL